MPFVVIQIVMVALVLALPGMVISKKPPKPVIDPTKAMEQLNVLPAPSLDAPPALKF